MPPATTSAMRTRLASTPSARTTAHARVDSPATDDIVCLSVIHTASTAENVCRPIRVNVGEATRAPRARKI